MFGHLRSLARDVNVVMKFGCLISLRSQWFFNEPLFCKSVPLSVNISVSLFDVQMYICNLFIVQKGNVSEPLENGLCYLHAT